MWMKKPLYEALPFVYMLLGGSLLAASFYIDRGYWPTLFIVLGLACVTGGLVLWLKRRDYRSSRSRSTFTESP